MKTSGNTILITGATSGIGLAFAEQFIKEGNTVIVCARRATRLTELQQAYPGIITRQCDIGNTAAREELCQWVVATYPSLNVLINNAGIQLATDLTQPVHLEEVREEIEINLIAPIHLSSLLAGHLQTKPEAAIINISSGLAFVPIAFMPVYCATKAALHSLTISQRHQLRHTSVRVFEIAPPSVDTELGHQHREDKTQSHGGLPVSEFLTEAMEAIRNDLFEAPIGHAKNLRAKREEAFPFMNKT